MTTKKFKSHLDYLHIAAIPATAAGRAEDAAENVGGPNYSNRSGRPRKMRNKFLFRLPFSLPKNHLMFPKPQYPKPKTKILFLLPDYLGIAHIRATVAGRARDAAENVGGPILSNRPGRPRKMRNKFLFLLVF